jgi:hypothetical protein
MGGKRVTQRGLVVVEVIARPQPAAGPRRRARPEDRHRRGEDLWLRRRGSHSRAASTSTPEVFGAAWNETLVHECVRAELGARRQGSALHSHAREGARRRHQAVRRKGTGRARAGSIRSRSGRRRHRVRPPRPRRYTVKVNRKARRARCAARCRCTPLAARSPWSTRPGSTRRRPRQARRAGQVGRRPARRCRAGRRARCAARKSFRNLAPRAVVLRADAGASPASSARPRSSCPRRRWTRSPRQGERRREARPHPSRGRETEEASA